MSDFKGVLKNGWHPKGKDGGKESWRGDFKGINQVAGWMGKGKTSETQAAKEHISRPLATLKDPALFGPPPKNVNYHGGAALPDEITPHRSGLGAPLNQAEIESANQAVELATEEEDTSTPAAAAPPPPLPYRADRTGLRTDTLPPPPIHRNRAQVIPPVQFQPSSTVSQPKLPPRLPARQNTAPAPVAEIPPPSYETVNTKPPSDPYLNQSAVSRLGNAGISVPGFGIEPRNEPNPWEEEKSQSQKPNTSQFSDIQSRFAKMKAPSQDSVSATTPMTATDPAKMPSWKQSQSAFKTAQNLRTNPQSVTLADAQSAAQTAGQAQRSANAFREKHADSIANAQAKAKAWDQRYKVTSKINKFLDEHTDPEEGNASQQQQPHPQHPSQSGQQFQQQTPTVAPYSPTSQTPAHSSIAQQAIPSPPPTEFAASIARKPPPPPAPRKPAHMQAPPPVPTGTKPLLG